MEILEQQNLKKTTNLPGLISALSKKRSRYKASVCFSNAATYHTPSCLITHKGCGLYHDWKKIDLRRPHGGRLRKLLPRSTSFKAHVTKRGNSSRLHC
jgi:hypothetical protein